MRPIPRQPDAQRAAVRLNESSEEWLHRAHDALPRLIGSTAYLEAWLDWDPDERTRLEVHIGERPVGTLDDLATNAYQTVMTLAGERDEVPYTHARLTAGQTFGGYLLEVQLPA